MPWFRPSTRFATSSNVIHRTAEEVQRLIEEDRIEKEQMMRAQWERERAMIAAMERELLPQTPRRESTP